jgi:hypothetical protein
MVFALSNWQLREICTTGKQISIQVITETLLDTHAKLASRQQPSSRRVPVTVSSSQPDEARKLSMPSLVSSNPLTLALSLTIRLAEIRTAAEIGRIVLQISCYFLDSRLESKDQYLTAVMPAEAFATDVEQRPAAAKPASIVIHARFGCIEIFYTLRLHSVVKRKPHIRVRVRVIAFEVLCSLRSTKLVLVLQTRENYRLWQEYLFASCSWLPQHEQEVENKC